MGKEITFETELLTVDNPSRYSQDFRVTADIAPSELIGQFDAREILEHTDRDNLLDEIGEDYVREYFGIEPETEES